jgi:hypothetical protein
MSLKRIGPVSSIALTNFLNGVGIFGKGTWREERVLGILQKLKAVTVRDGSVEVRHRGTRRAVQHKRDLT